MRGLRTVTRPIAWTSALLSALLLIYLGGVPLFYHMALAARDPLPTSVDLGAMAIVTFFLGIVFARFLLRSLPVRADGQRRTFVLVIVSAWFLIGIAVMLLIVTGVIEAPETSTEQQAAGFPDESAGQPTAGFLPGFALATIAWLLGASIPFVTRHLAPRHFLGESYLLYLRRFYSFSDRVVVGAVLKAAPPGSPVAFLLAPLSTARDWNPFTVGMAGFKFWRPIRSLPIDLHSEEPWQDNARTLIEHAGLIVLDGTEGSQAISAEMAMIRDGGFAERTVVLAPWDASVDDDSFDEIGVHGSSIVRYRKSWMRALPGMFLGAVGSVMAVFPIGVIALLLSQGVDWQASDPLVWSMPVVVSSGIGCAALFVALFLRPALDRKTEKELKKRLRGGDVASKAQGSAA